MKKLFKKFETVMEAVTFAEAGEFATAKELLNEDRSGETDKLLTKKNSEDRRILGTEQVYGEAGR